MRHLSSLYTTAVLIASARLVAADFQLLGWNNLGMHCMDSDYSVLSILPPYNTVEAQLLAAGKLVTNGSDYTVTYEAVADPDGSFNCTAQGKGNFYDFVKPLYGVALPVDAGLGPWPMPGPQNAPQPMLFEQTNRPAPGAAPLVNWFRAEGIPITPYDDAGRKNPYPLMRLIARTSGGTPVATNDVVLPVSDEMDCRACHASGTQFAAQPSNGWVWSTNPERDYRLNILRLHDEHQFARYAQLYASALADRGFNPQGLYRNVVADSKPILCAVCHASEALGTASYGTVPPLTASVHLTHASVTDPALHVTLDSSAHRAACYRCHPGSATKCLRGAMGGAIALDGTLEMQCQSCHGGMSKVGASNRVGWFMEPNCQSCHTGTATSNNGQIRYTSSFDNTGAERVPVNTTFATKPNTPATGLSLYRFSAGHGGLQCSACHGSTHAEFPATHRNDNLRNLAIQGHAGVTVECLTCHVSMPVNATTAVAGPHGLHPINQAWADTHGDLIELNGALRAACANCHAADGTGTVLSRAQQARTLPTKDNKYGTKQYWRGRSVSCYDCHDGPNSTDPSTHPQAVATNVSTSTVGGTPVALPLQVAGPGTLAYRIVSQPQHGTAGISNTVAIYSPEPGFVGTDQFAYAAWNGWVDSTLATGTVSVAAGPVSVNVTALVPPNNPVGWLVPFSAVPTLTNSQAEPVYDWDFGDGSPHGNSRYASHSYSAAGTYNWSVTARVGTASATAQGSIRITSPLALQVAATPDHLSITCTWPAGGFDGVLETAPALQSPTNWLATTNQPVYGPATITVTLQGSERTAFFRLRKVL